MSTRFHVSHLAIILTASLLACLALALPAQAQTETTGAFSGIVRDPAGAPVIGARVLVTYKVNGFQNARVTDQNGQFYLALLGPGLYTINVSKPGFQTRELRQTVYATQTNSVIPVPVTLPPESVIATPTPTPAISPSSQPTPSPTQSPTPASAPQTEEDIRVNINITDGRRGGAFTEQEIVTLPLGATTLVRSFDELALLLPGVALPPQTFGVAGPGVGSGVGSAGQFTVNGLRSRANNFTVDGSDNNDEDIGVRRQGFFSLIPQPIESIQEYRVITLLAPAQFGRNIGAQVNALSKSGTSETHGTLYGFFNSSQLNARNFFDTANGEAASPLLSGNQNVFVGRNFVFNGLNPDNSCTFGADPRGFCIGQFEPLIRQPITVQNQSGGEDSSTLGQFGFAFGGPIKRGRLFYFVSTERQILNARQEESFAVPTVAQRGFQDSGATGFTTDFCSAQNPSACLRLYPTSTGGNAIFSLFPFPNNPNGVYEENTFTQTLPASARGTVFSGKLDGNFVFKGRPQSAVARYNFTNDERIIPVTGGALFSSLQPEVRTNNFSFFLNSEVSRANASSPIFNQVRLSYGRTRLNFEEVRDTQFQLPAGLGLNNREDRRFLLNATLLQNFTLPPSIGLRNTGPVFFNSGLTSEGVPFTTEGVTGPLGQVRIAGFSPIGVDVFNFPQRRVNNTYQVADTLTVRVGNHNTAFGADIRRSELNSDLPRNSRPLVTFNGGPLFSTSLEFTGEFIRPLDLASAGAATGFLQTLVTDAGSSKINLRYYQLNFFGQDEWRVRPNLSLSFGLRYEYNTPPRETSRRIENTFNSLSLNEVPGLIGLINGRREIFDPDRNNFAPRIGFAYSPRLFGNRTTVFRGGYGIFYDQILGAVVSQSRNVFPNALTVNFGGGPANIDANGNIDDLTNFTFFNPINTLLTVRNPAGNNIQTLLVNQGTLNTLNPLISLSELIRVNNLFFANNNNPGESSFGATLPARHLEMPMAHHYSLTFEQQVSRNLIVSAAYVGTQGRNLLRFTTPNLGENQILVPLEFSPPPDSNVAVNIFVPNVSGLILPPGFKRPINGVGAVNLFETTAESRYDALQLQARGRFLRSAQFQLAYTFSKVTDDVSDVFEMAGASSLPQDSITFEGERGPANFDVRHRFTYNVNYVLPEYRNRSRALRFLFGGLELTSTGQLQSGQPFTVHSIFDVNLDGNLTDRLDTLEGIQVTGDNRRPLRMTVDPFLNTLIAPPGENGSIGRNTFRAASLLLMNLAVVKNFAIKDRQKLTFRAEILNLTNRANFGIPVRFLEAPGFGTATNTVTPGRRVQFALKYSF